MTPALDVHDLSFGYGRQPVLRQVSFKIGQGGFFVIIGPNGSGKTTLLRIMAGLQGGFSGSVRVQGEAVQGIPPRRLARIIGHVPQQRTEPCPFSVREMVLLGRAPHLGVFGLERASDRETAEQAMRFTQVAHLAERSMDELSGGEAQRVVIARALCQEPSIMLLDEPTAALDLAHQVRIMDLMERLCRDKGMTVVMVSHDLNLAAMYGRHLLLLKEGRVLRQGPPKGVLTFETLEEAYGCVLLSEQSPLGDYPRVTPVPGRYLSRQRTEDS